MTKREINQADPFESEYFNDYYKDYRRNFVDLFDSEKYFLKEFINENETIYDVGCAVGGMYEILSSMKSEIRYQGVDIAEKMIDQARKNYPNINFEVVDGINLPEKDDSFDGVLSFGTTVHEQQWEKLISELWRVTKQDLLFDIRFVDDLPTISNLSSGFVDDGSGLKYPYVVINYNDFVNLISSLSPKPNITKIYGYFGSANDDVTLPKEYSKICMSCVLLKKNFKNVNNDKSSIELPFNI